MLPSGSTFNTIDRIAVPPEAIGCVDFRVGVQRLAIVERELVLVID
jgi:hypothetical protein